MARICILLLTLAVAALGQTSADLSAKYPNVAYRIRPHVLMTARFAPDGQVCEMRRCACASTIAIARAPRAPHVPRPDEPPLRARRER